MDTHSFDKPRTLHKLCWHWPQLHQAACGLCCCTAGTGAAESHIEKKERNPEILELKNTVNEKMQQRALKTYLIKLEERIFKLKINLWHYWAKRRKKEMKKASGLMEYHCLKETKKWWTGIWIHVLNITNHQAMQIKTTVKYQFILVKMTVIKMEIDKDVGKDVEKSIPALLVGMYIGVVKYEELWALLQKLKRELPSGSSDPTSGYMYRGNEIRILKRYLYPCLSLHSS